MNRFPLEPKTPPPPHMCPLPGYACACKGDWCRLRGYNLSNPPKPTGPTP